MDTTIEKKVTVNFEDDLSVRNVIQTTVKALKRAKQDKRSKEFQVEVVSGKPMLEVVKKYVTIV